MWNILKQNSWLVKNIAFLIVFSHLFMSVSYVLRPFDKESRNIIMGFYAEEQDSLDVVLVGASSIYTYWVPLEAYKEYGFTSYNFGSPAMHPESLLPNIKEILKYQSPQVLIIDLRRFSSNQTLISNNRFRQNVDSLKYSLNRVQSILEVVPNRMDENNDTNIYNYLFDIAQYHSTWKTLNSNRIESYNNINENYQKGHILNSIVDKQIDNFRINNNISEVSQPNEYTIKLFENLIQYLLSIETNIVFLVSPYDESVSHRMYHNYYETIINQNGFKYINANDYLNEMEVTNYIQYFYNDRHMNIFGAEKFTEFLGNYLIENYDLPDKRNSPNYSYWHDDYVLWEIDSENTKLAISKILNE